MKLLSYFLSSIFAVVYFVCLLIFHPLQWIGYHFFGYKGHRFVVDIMNWTLMKTLLILGIRTKFTNKQTLPKNQTLIFVSNHQSLFDICPLGWYFRKHQPKFVSKIELGKGIPSVSINLRLGGSALIDRKNPRQAISTLGKFAKKIHKNNWSAVIFPEGTRSRTGKLKPFSTSGLKMIVKYNPDSYIVSVTINNSWKVFKYGKFPLGIGSPITITTHKPIKINTLPFDELMQKVTNEIKQNVQ